MRRTFDFIAKNRDMEGAKMKVLAATLISLSLSAWAASHAHTSGISSRMKSRINGAGTVTATFVHGPEA